MASEPLLLKNVGIADSWTIDSYLKSGGYEGLKRVLREFEPEAFATEVKNAGLRGRGGAGFPTGVKWGFLPKNVSTTRCSAIGPSGPTAGRP